MMMYERNNKYEAFSLIEMLITIIILGFILITCALVLTTLIKVSTVSTNKTRVRTESEYMQELLRRTIRTTDPTNAVLFNSHPVRQYNPATSEVVSAGQFSSPGSGYGSPKPENEVGNEIHLKPFGSNKWICVAFFYEVGDKMEADGVTRKGYVLKTSMPDTEYVNAADCFDSQKNKPHNYIVLNSRFVNVSEMEIIYTSTENKNKEFVLNLHSDAIYWYFSKGAPLKKDIFRQSIIKTEGVMW